MLYLEDLIKFLEKLDQDKIVKFGFGEPHSFRGYYQDLAFDRVDNARIGDMLSFAKGAIGKTFTGYKGGEYTMEAFTDVWISNEGTSNCADRIGITLMSYWSAH